MKVATRITMATAVAVAVASASYAYFDLRGRRTERQQALRREALIVATLLRFNVESQAAAIRTGNTDGLVRDLSRVASSDWKVTVIPRVRAAGSAGPDVSAA